MRPLPEHLEPERILDAKQGAALWGVSLATFRRLHRAGRLPTAIRLSERRLGWRCRDLLSALERRATAEEA
jgi:predicted DNA-binding transcriptional regulator AlpA